MSAFAELQQRLGHAFRDENLLYLALTHPSVAHDANAPQPHNQRLEFLGDSVLGLTLAQALYEKFPDADEGVLTKSRAKLVNAAALADHARTLNLGAHLILSRGEENTGGRIRASALARLWARRKPRLVGGGPTEQPPATASRKRSASATENTASFLTRG